jgi:hypothetical protein
MIRALDYLKREQETDGPRFGRWGVNYIYGTVAALPALAAGRHREGHGSDLDLKLRRSLPFVGRGFEA